MAVNARCPHALARRLPRARAEGLGSARVRLRLDHLIIRAEDPAAVMAELTTRAGMPVLAEVEALGGMSSGIVRAGDLDIEVLRVGREPLLRPHGYGIGLVADVGLDEAIAALRSQGFATSAALPGVAGQSSQRPTWRATQVRGLLPDPFPAPATTRPPSRIDATIARIAGALTRIPAVARLASRRAGSSMVVVTEYGFDAGAWRAGAAGGPRVEEVHVRTAGHREAWERLELADSRLQIRDEGPAGIARVVLAADATATRDDPRVGDVAFAFASR